MVIGASSNWDFTTQTWREDRSDRTWKQKGWPEESGVCFQGNGERASLLKPSRKELNIYMPLLWVAARAPHLPKPTLTPREMEPHYVTMQSNPLGQSTEWERGKVGLQAWTEGVSEASAGDSETGQLGRSLMIRAFNNSSLSILAEAWETLFKGGYMAQVKLLGHSVCELSILELNYSPKWPHRQYTKTTNPPSIWPNTWYWTTFPVLLI